MLLQDNATQPMSHHRVNHFDLTLRECDDAAGSDDSSEDDEGAIDLGNGMGD